MSFFFFFNNNKKKSHQILNVIIRSCSFHQNVIKLIGYTLEPERYIVTKKYELDLFHFIHHPTEELHPLLAMKFTK